ncbi:MAG: hypothetical protein ACKVVT_12115 [Dehalococcoidia bacterium]
MTTPPKLTELLESLVARTRAGRLRWEPVPGRDDWFAYNTPSARILVGSLFDNGQWPHGIRVLDTRGVEVMRHEERWLDGVGNPVNRLPESETEEHEVRLDRSLSELYDLVRSSDPRVADVLDKVLADLERVPA